MKANLGNGPFFRYYGLAGPIKFNGLNGPGQVIFDFSSGKLKQGFKGKREARKLIQIQPLEKKHFSGILTIVENLPEWFDESARSKAVPTDIRHQMGFVAVSGQREVGFVTLYVAEGRLPHRMACGRYALS